MNDIYKNSLALDVFCLDIIEGAVAYYKANPPKNKNTTLRGRVEFWVENHLQSAIQAAIDGTFEDEED